MANALDPVGDFDVAVEAEPDLAIRDPGDFSVGTKLPALETNPGTCGREPIPPSTSAPRGDRLRTRTGSETAPAISEADRNTFDRPCERLQA